MRLKGNRGVSPVVGIILLTAVTVALVSLAAFFVFDIGRSSTSGVGTATTTVEYESESSITVSLVKKSSADKLIVRSALGTEYSLDSVGESVSILNQDGNETPVVLSEKDGERTVLQSVPPRSFTPDIVVAKGDAGNYSSISEAVKNAVDGDIIVVRKDVYYENIDISTANITLVGESGTVIADNSSDTAVIEIQSKGVRVSNFDVNASSSQGGSAAEYAVRSSVETTVVQSSFRNANTSNEKGDITQLSSPKLVSPRLIGLSTSPAAIPSSVKRVFGTRFDGGGNDRALSVATGPSGGFAVTGSDQGMNARVRTTKYDSSGTEVWTRTFDKDNNDEGKAVAIDSAGDVIVVSEVFRVDNDWRVAKYDANGTELWSRYYDGGNGQDTPRSVSADSQDNIIVTGYTKQSDGDFDWRTVKYDSAGNQVWVDLYDGGQSEYGMASAIDSQDNIVLGGFINGVDGSNDWRVAKYDGSGSLIWSNTYDLNGSQDRVASVATDKNDNVLATGRVFDGVRSWRVAKYNSSGVLKWDAIYNTGGSERPSGIAVGVEGGVVVSGSKSGSTTDWFVIKYSKSGSRVWNQTYDGGNRDISKSIAVNKNGSVIAVGNTVIDADGDWRIEKYGEE